MNYVSKLRVLNRKGIIVVWLALSLLVLLLALAGMAIDGSYMYYVKNQLQVAADAAALAGGPLLDGTNSTTQMAARQQAWKFACKNTADRSNPDPGGPNNNVYLVTNSVSDCNNPPTSGLNEGTNDARGDIVVGNWDPTRSAGTSSCDDQRFLPTVLCDGTTVVPLPAGAAINALKAVARRTGDVPVPNVKFGSNPVRLFLGQILRLIGANWSFMNVMASAIAGPSPLTTPALTICIETCPISVPATLSFATGAVTNGLAWTEFDCNSATPLGPGSLVVQYINGAPLPVNPCGQCVVTNNGVGYALQHALPDAFSSTTFDSGNKTFDSHGNVTSWTVAVAVTDFQCTGCPGSTTTSTSACPPGTQPTSIHIVQWAKITITSVITTGPNKGVTISAISCIPGCALPNSAGGSAKLVK